MRESPGMLFGRRKAAAPSLGPTLHLEQPNARTGHGSVSVLTEELAELVQRRAHD